jgi:hypothetical protein
MSPVWLLISNRLRKDERSQIYHIINKGVNLYDNLKEISEDHPVKYKGKRFFTEKVENPDVKNFKMRENQLRSKSENYIYSGVPL